MQITVNPDDTLIIETDERRLNLTHEEAQQLCQMLERRLGEIWDRKRIERINGA